MVAEADDALMEKFFEAGTLTQEELVDGLHTATLNGKIYPLVCASVGAEHRLASRCSTPSRTICPRLPSGRSRRRTRSGTRRLPRRRTPSDPYAAFVWKTVADPFAGRITLFRVMTGTLKSDATVHNLTRDTSERLGHLTVMQGKTPTSVPELKAGDLGAVAKLKDTLTNDVLAEKGGLTFAPIAFIEPVLSYAIEPKSRGDEDKISTAMHRLEEEDPTIRYARDPQTKELLLSGQGQLHIEVTVAKLKRRFGVEVNLKPPRIPYRETITAPTEAHGRHKKQTGGHGQFGDCKIRMEPLPRGSDFTFEDDIFGGSIPRQFVPAVEKGIQDARMRGYLAGYPVVDFKVTVYRRLLPRRRQQRALVQARGFAGVQGRHGQGASDDPRAGDVGRDSCAERLRRRPHGRSQRPARTDQRHGHAWCDDADSRAGADGGDAHLRAAPHVRHRRTRLLPHGVLALRRGSVTPATKDHRRGESRAGRGG